ncbi:MAG: hypothetical protein IJI44_02600 [Erysipelotrichaceae bacterium]|nr:hypothetical protein [Erysipelotrichaceae bacterium]
MNSRKKEALQQIAVYSLCHCGIDFLCAFSLYRSFRTYPEVFLLYNYCAFALQMPIGILIDFYSRKNGKMFNPALFCMIAGIVLTAAGSFLSPLILGLGNALFHAGGGVLTIHEDDLSEMKGRGLGIFVAPGAIGLSLGMLFYDTEWYSAIRILVSAGLLFLGFVSYRNRKEMEMNKDAILPGNRKILYLILCCFAVVVLRSLTGMAISFPWKDTPWHIFLSVLFLASGKTAGGLLSARFGMKKTILITLFLSAVFYAFSNQMLPGLLALFFFNMTMPLTLYLLARNMKQMPGFAFGILTFGLFLGYLPVLYGMIRNIPPYPFGSVASIVSLVILLAAAVMGENNE